MMVATVTFIHDHSLLWHTQFNNSCSMAKHFLQLAATFFIYKSAELLFNNKLFFKFVVENLLKLWYLKLKHMANSKLNTF
jgi:hypothetical protein